MNAADIQISIVTVAARPQYLRGTIASLLGSGADAPDMRPVMLIPGSSETEYLSGLARDGRCGVVPMLDEDWDRIADWGVHRRTNFNLVRAVRTCPGDAAGLCLCEDDLLFCADFLPKLLAAIGEIEARRTRYVLSAYAPYDLEDPAIAQGRWYCDYARPFYGTQCMYYPSSVLGELAGFICRWGVETCSDPNDLLVKRFAASRKMLLATRRSLVQHVGSVSTGLGDGQHRSPTFGRESPLPEPPRRVLRGGPPLRFRQGLPRLKRSAG